MKNLSDVKFTLRFFGCIFLVLAFAFTNADAQPQCPLSMAVTYAPIQQLSISDVDFEHFESRTLLFTLRIQNHGNLDAVTRLNIRLNIRLANGKIYDDALFFRSKEITVPPGTLILTNLDIGRRGKIQKDEFDLSDDAKKNVQDVAFATGKFPAGRYLYYISLEEPGCSDVSDDFVLVIENSTRIDLISPMDGETTGEYPLFEFYHDGPAAELTVAEKSADQSRDDAIERAPAMVTVELSGQNTFLYSGGRPLENGKTYVWKVVSKISGPAGSSIEIASPVREFTVSSTASSGPDSKDKDAGSLSEDELLKLLGDLFSAKYPSIIAEIRKNGFTYSTGSHNSRQFSKQEIMQLLKMLYENATEITLSFE